MLGAFCITTIMVSMQEESQYVIDSLINHDANSICLSNKNITPECIVEKYIPNIIVLPEKHSLASFIKQEYARVEHQRRCFQTHISLESIHFIAHELFKSVKIPFYEFITWQQIARNNTILIELAEWNHKAVKKIGKGKHILLAEIAATILWTQRLYTLAERSESSVYLANSEEDADDEYSSASELSSFEETSSRISSCESEIEE